MTATAAATPETVWLLDVDGVVNASRPGWGAAPRRVFAYAGVEEFKLRYAPTLLRRIKALHATGLVEIVWTTTWCPWADQLERLFGLPELRRAWTDDLRGWYAAEAKRAAARGVLADGRRLIWTDDTAVPRSGPLYDELTAAGRALLLRPDARVGIQPDQMDAIEAFAREGQSDVPVPAIPGQDALGVPAVPVHREAPNAHR